MSGDDMSLSATYPVILKKSQVEQGAEVLARALQHAPDMKFLVGDNNRMHDRATLRFYQSVIQIGLLYGAVYTTPAVDGVAVWMSPETTNFSLGILFRTGFLTTLLSLGMGPTRRFLSSTTYIQKLEEQAISGPRWTLVYLGVEPARQRHGIGGILLQPTITLADAEGMPCYVESADERNLSFYKKHGFSIVVHGKVPKGGPQVWALVREAGIQ